MLGNKLQYANEMTLKNRLKELVCQVNIQSFKDIIGKENKFIVMATKNRHYYTHYNPDLKKVAYHGKELSRMTCKFRAKSPHFSA